MMIQRLSLVLILLADTAAAETLVATRTLRAQTILSTDDMTLIADIVPGAVGTLADVVGLETRVAIYQGQPIFQKNLGPPAVVERNQTVQLAFQSGTLTILSEGRALERGGVGDRIRVMNVASRATISGFVAADGTVRVDASN